MSYTNQQVGWGTKAKLLQQISKQLDRLIKVSSHQTFTTTTTTTNPPTTTTTTTP